MKATTLVLPVVGALLASTLAFAGGHPVQTQEAKPAVVKQAVKDTGATPGKKKEPAGKASTAVAKTKGKTAARRRVHHGKHQPKKTDAQQQPKK